MKKRKALTGDERQDLILKLVAIIAYVWILMFGGLILRDIFRMLGWGPARW